MEKQYIVGSLCTQTPSAACGLWRANLINILYENRYIWRNGDMEKGRVENMLQISSSAASYCFPLNSPWWTNNVREDGILLHVPSIYLPFPEYWGESKLLETILKQWALKPHWGISLFDSGDKLSVTPQVPPAPYHRIMIHNWASPTSTGTSAGKRNNFFGRILNSRIFPVVVNHNKTVEQYL